MTQKNRIIVIIVLLFTFSLCSCGPKLQQPTKLQRGPINPFPPPDSEDVYFPSLNEETAAEIGDALISKARVCSYKAITLSKPIEHYGKDKGWDFKLVIPAGILYAIGENFQGTFFEYPDTLTFQGLNYYQKVRYQENIRGGVVISSSDGIQTMIWFSDNPSIYDCATDTTPPFSYKDINKVIWLNDSFKRELVYNGRSGDTIRFMYREFSCSDCKLAPDAPQLFASTERLTSGVEKTYYARPAFTQEIVYDLDIGKTIGFKGAMFKILKADNQEIQYTVIKHLN